jgi:hypothetical protein
MGIINGINFYRSEHDELVNSQINQICGDVTPIVVFHVGGDATKMLTG